MNFVTETITPAKAVEYLKTSNGNRPISKPSVLSYADTMKKGGWLQNGVCIIFDTDGHLIDGHHRLLAVIEAGIPVLFDVCRGASQESFSTYDCGHSRNLSQLIAMQGHKHYRLVASIVMANESILSKGRLFGNNSKHGHVKRSNADKYNLYREDPQGFDATAIVIVRLSGRCRIMAESWAGGIYYYLTHTGGYSEGEVLPFFEALFSVDNSAIIVADMLRKALTKANLSGKRLLPEVIWGLTAKAWNYYITGAVPKILRYQHTVEPIPTLRIKNATE